MKILFITRSYTPDVGGMEKFTIEFHENYNKIIGKMDLLANTGGKKTLPSFFFRAIIFIILNSHKYDLIHMGDAVLSPLTIIIKLFSNAKVSCTVHGLDVVYTKFFYQRYIPFFLKKIDHIIANSLFTMEQCIKRGISKERLTVIPIGFCFDPKKLNSEVEINAILSKFEIPAQKINILLTVGRLVKRKGHAWFIENVMAQLPENYIYLIAGSGPESSAISQISQKSGLSDRVLLLGRISEEEKNCLYQISDKFVMPNIFQENDQEGFGIVLLEAGQYGLPAIASNIEGIKDAVIDHITGRLVEEKNIQQYIYEIINFQPDRSQISGFLESKFNWERVVKMYNNAFQNLLK